MENQNRYKPKRTYTLAPNSIDRLAQLAKLWDLSYSGVLDQLIRQEAERQGIRVSEKVEA